MSPKARPYEVGEVVNGPDGGMWRCTSTGTTEARHALLAADALRSLAETMRGEAEDWKERATFAALLPTDRAMAAERLRALPPASEEHPYPLGDFAIRFPGATDPVRVLAAALERGTDWLTADRIEDFAEALARWDGEEAALRRGRR